jgi:hypothetical protein
MTQIDACNCIVCSKEFDSSELQSIALSKINVTRFKICQGCLDCCDPSEDYNEARKIISSYLWIAESKNAYKEVSAILEDIKKK